MGQAAEMAKWRDWDGEPLVTVGTPSARTQRAVRRRASMCAAWFVWEHRDQLKRQRAIYAVLPACAPEPPWLGLALQELQRRPRWRVQTALVGLKVYYRVEWRKR